jgi:hypothetical protein
MSTMLEFPAPQLPKEVSRTGMAKILAAHSLTKNRGPWYFKNRVLGQSCAFILCWRHAVDTGPSVDGYGSTFYEVCLQDKYDRL